MNKNNIKVLVDKYFDGETSLDEERQLKSYFNSDVNIDADLEVFIPFFKEISQQQSIEAPSNLEQRVFAVISKSDDKLDKEIKPTVKVRRLMPMLLKVASVFVIGLSIYFLTQQMNKPSTETMAMTEDTYKTPEEAYAAYKAAISLASRKIKKGEDKMKEKMSHVKILTSIVKSK